MKFHPSIFSAAVFAFSATTMMFDPFYRSGFAEASDDETAAAAAVAGSLEGLAVTASTIERGRTLKSGKNGPPPPPPPGKNGPPPPPPGPSKKNSKSSKKNRPAPFQGLPETLADKGYTTLVDALVAADLADDLSPPEGRFTVMAPTNEAFDSLQDNLFDCLRKPQYVEELREVLLYHAASGELLARQLSNDQEIEMLDDETILITTVDGVDVEINGYSVVEQPNMFASNGIAHGISYVLIPPTFNVGEFLRVCLGTDYPTFPTPPLLGGGPDETPPPLGVGLNRYTLQYPFNVTDTMSLNEVNRLCTDHFHAVWAGAENITAHSRSEYDACGLTSSNAGYEQVTLGPFKTRVNLHEAITTFGYRTLPQKSSVFTPLFQNNAIALMIQRGCFFHDGSTAVTKSSDIQFEDSSSYSQSFSKSNEIDVEAKVGYSGVSATAGYNTKNSNTDGTGGAEQYAFGQKQAHSRIATLTNKCFLTKGDPSEDVLGFSSVSDLLDPKWEVAWNTIRDAEDALSLIETDAFEAVALGGLVVATMFEAGAKVEYNIKSTYVKTNSTSSSSMSNAISAGLEATIPGGPSTSVKTTVKKSVDETAASEGITQSTEVTEESRGPTGMKVSTTCFQDNSCNDQVQEAANTCNADPLCPFITVGQEAVTTIGDFMNWTVGEFDDTVFLDALSIYFRSNQCKDPMRNQTWPGSPSSMTNFYDVVNGDGTVQETAQCFGNKQCMLTIDDVNSGSPTQLCEQVDPNWCKLRCESGSCENYWILSETKQDCDAESTAIGCGGCKDKAASLAILKKDGYTETDGFVSFCRGGPCVWTEQLTQCNGLTKNPALTTAEACKKACCDDKNCAVWQFSAAGYVNQCWYGANCNNKGRLTWKDGGIRKLGTDLAPDCL